MNVWPNAWVLLGICVYHIVRVEGEDCTAVEERMYLSREKKKDYAGSESHFPN